MENIKESLIMAMLENQCKILAKLKSLERKFESDMIVKNGYSNEIIEQFKTTSENEETEYKTLLISTFERAEEINKELNREIPVFQDL